MFKCGFAFVSKPISMHEKIHEKNLDNKPSGILNWFQDVYPHSAVAF